MVIAVGLNQQQISLSGGQLLIYHIDSGKENKGSIHKMIKIAVMGYGTIGSGVVKVIGTNQESICRKIGEGIEVKYILDLRDFEGDPIQSKVVHDYQVIAEDPEVAIVVESMGGVEPAHTFVKAMLLAGKSVTTSNKALVAVHGAELIAIAKEKNVNFMFEASVGGGIPIIRALNSCLTADRIEEINGIVNGTTNYMMTRMAQEGCDFDEALKDAQEKGFAEKDPTADIEGHDAGRKIAILTSLIARPIFFAYKMSVAVILLIPSVYTSSKSTC